MKKVLILIIVLIIFTYFKSTENYDEYSPDELYESLSYISDVFKKNSIKHWVCYGTLLGAVRSNDIIKYDYDFDLGAFISDYDKIMELNKIIKKDGYEFARPSDNYGYSWNGDRKYIWRVSIKIVYKGKIMGDIYLSQPFKDGMCRRYDIENDIYFWPKATFPTWFVRKLNRVRIRNKYFPSPRRPEILLKHWYGKYWRIPYKAMAQGGSYNSNYDYYGGNVNMKLNDLVLFRDYEYRNLPIYPRKIKYYTPEWGKKWILENDYSSGNMATLPKTS